MYIYHINIHDFICIIYISGLLKIKKWLGSYSHFDQGPKGQYYFCRGEHQILQLIYDSRSHLMILAATLWFSQPLLWFLAATLAKWLGTRFPGSRTFWRSDVDITHLQCIYLCNLLCTYMSYLCIYINPKYLAFHLHRVYRCWRGWRELRWPPFSPASSVEKRQRYVFFFEISFFGCQRCIKGFEGGLRDLSTFL